MGRKSGPKAEDDVACVAVEQKNPKKIKRKAEELIEKKKQKQKKAEVEIKTEKKKKKKIVKEQASSSHDDKVVPPKKAVLSAKKKDKIWEDETDSSSFDEIDVFLKSSDDSDSDSDVIEGSNGVMVYIRDGCYRNANLAYVDEELRRHLSSCEGIT